MFKRECVYHFNAHTHLSWHNHHWYKKVYVIEHTIMINYSFPPTRSNHDKMRIFSSNRRIFPFIVYCKLRVYTFLILLYILIYYFVEFYWWWWMKKDEMRINDAPRLSPIVKAKHTFLFIFLPNFDFYFPFMIWNFLHLVHLWMRTNVLVCAQHASLLIWQVFWACGPSVVRSLWLRRISFCNKSLSL